MARSRSLALCFLIPRMFMLLLICLNTTKAAMGYDLLLATGLLLFCGFFSYQMCSLDRVGAGELFDKFWLLAVGFSSDLAMCLTAKVGIFSQVLLQFSIFFFKSIDLLY